MDVYLRIARALLGISFVALFLCGCGSSDSAQVPQINRDDATERRASGESKAAQDESEQANAQAQADQRRQTAKDSFSKNTFGSSVASTGISAHSGAAISTHADALGSYLSPMALGLAAVLLGKEGPKAVTNLTKYVSIKGKQNSGSTPNPVDSSPRQGAENKTNNNNCSNSGLRHSSLTSEVQGIFHSSGY